MTSKNKVLILIVIGLLSFTLGAFLAPQVMTTEEKLGVTFVVVSMLLIGCGVGLSYREEIK